MPPIQGLTVGANVLQVTNKDVVQSLNTLIIPSTDPVTVETWLNNTYLLPIANDQYQLVAHVVSTNPLNVLLLSLNLGEPVPNNWWDRSKK